MPYEVRSIRDRFRRKRRPAQRGSGGVLSRAAKVSLANRLSHLSNFERKKWVSLYKSKKHYG